MNGMQMGSPFGSDPFGTAVVIIGTAAASVTFVLAFRATFWPGETAPEHPKNIIFKDGR